jgi:hypothetical protein
VVACEGACGRKPCSVFKTEAKHANAMTTAYTTLGLRKRPFSFSEDLSAVFNYAPLSADYRVSDSPQIAVIAAIGSRRRGASRG